MIVCVYELDNTLAPQTLDFFQHFGGELLGVAGHDVTLDPVGANPAEIAERASPPGRVFLLQMSVKLLDPSKIFVAFWADRSRTAIHSTISVAHGEALDNEPSSGSVGMDKIGGVCLAGWGSGLYICLDPTKGGFDLRAKGKEVSMSNFLVAMSCFHYLVVHTVCFKG